MTTRSLLRILLFIVVFIRAQCGFGQDFPMLHITSNEGLPGNTVYEVYRDSKGFLWFGTDKGVAKYDGSKFEVFTTFNGLPDNEVFQFSEDMYGRLWLVSFNGELCYFKDDTIHTSQNTPLLKLPFQLSHIKLVSPQKDSSIIVVFNNGSRFLNIGLSRHTIIDAKKVCNKQLLGDLLYRKKIAENRYKLTFANSILVVDTSMNVKQRYDVDTFVMDAGGNMQMFSSCQNQDYLFNTNHLYDEDMSPAAIYPARFHRDNYLNKVFVSQNNRFYATSNGLYINDSIRLLLNHNVSSVSNDIFGNYWISTLNDGVYVLKNNFRSTKSIKGAYEGRALYSFAHKKQLFFATTNNNLYCLKDTVVWCVVNYAEIMHEKPLPNTTQLFLVDSNYRYFNFTNNAFIYKENLYDKPVFVKNTDVGLGGKGLFYEDNSVFIQKMDALLKFRLDSPLREMPKFSRLGISAKEERILWAAKDNTDRLRYSTMSGIYRISDARIAEKQTVFGNISLKSFGFLGGDMVGYSTGNLLLVFRDVSKGLKIDTFMVQDCIWDEMYKIDDAHMLLGTNNLYRLLTAVTNNDKREYYLTVIDDPYVLLQPEAVSFNGDLCYFLKGGAVTVFDKGILTAKPPPPRVFFTFLRSGYNVRHVGESVTIPFGESKNINISFSVVSSVGNKVSYQYSISKNSRDYWTEIKGEDISLVNSGYGNYTVKIRARTTSSDFCKPVEFAMRVTRPFWVRWWFIVCLIAGMIYVTAFLSRKRLTYILNRKDKEHEMKVRFLRSEYKALNALMNPHFVFNTLNNVQGLINNNDKLAANEYLRVIADLIRQNMHNISKEMIPLQKEIDLVNNYLLLEKFRFKDKLNYNIIVDKGLDTSEIMIPPLLIQPLIENSIKHGILPLNSKEGAIYLNVFERKGNLCIEVKDNGVGLSHKKAEKLSTHESFGLKNIRDRIEQLSIIQGKTILFDIKERKNDTDDTQWTVVSIVIPLD